MTEGQPIRVGRARKTNMYWCYLAGPATVCSVKQSVDCKGDIAAGEWRWRWLETDGRTRAGCTACCFPEYDPDEPVETPVET